MPDVFTPFKNKCEGRASVRPLLDVPQPGELPLPADAKTAFDLESTPSLESLGFAQPDPSDPRAAIKFCGGESAALARVDHYLWKTDKVATYFESRLASSVTALF